MEKYTFQTFNYGLQQYTELCNKGLKKQANKYLQNFIYEFQSNLDEAQLNKILEDFCYECFDNEEYTDLKKPGNGILPHELNKLLWQFLKPKCDMKCMPHMRWIYQLYKNQYNPFDQQGEYNMAQVLKYAYEHKQCDQKTADLYFLQQLDWLQWGAHHFPDSCLTTKQLYIETIDTAEQIIREYNINEKWIKCFYEYKILYECYYKFVDDGKKGDFYKMCEEVGLIF